MKTHGDPTTSARRLGPRPSAEPERARAARRKGWAILAALLALSKRIQGGLLVTANTFRHPAVLAKMCTTIDRISNGRLDVGISAGWRPSTASSAWCSRPSATASGCSTRRAR
ncbi:MAG: LLM class flavin-dependent oxidoreductase [Chloroflexota bacterium]